MSVAVAPAQPPLVMSLPLELMQCPLLRQQSSRSVLQGQKRIIMLRKQGAIPEFTASSGDGSIQVSSAGVAGVLSGLLVGDILLEVNGATPSTPADATRLIQGSAASVRLSVLGGTRRMLLGRKQDKIGVTAEDRNDGPGVSITVVQKGSAAEREGLAVGDAILAVNGTLAINHEQAILGLVRTHLDTRPHEDIELTVLQALGSARYTS